MNKKFTISSVILSFAIFALPVQKSFPQAPKTVTNSIGMKLVLIPKGTFVMGSTPSEEGYRDDELQHEVKIGKDYYLGAFEVTQSQYEKIMKRNPSFFNGSRLEFRDP